MATKENKVQENVEGKYYVDDQCIACDACIQEAQKNFRMLDEQGYAIVFKQPENDQEEQDCQNAFNACPVSAIGVDG